MQKLIRFDGDNNNSGTVPLIIAPSRSLAKTRRNMTQNAASDGVHLVVDGFMPGFHCLIVSQTLSQRCSSKNVKID